jgi:hypothetical protein
VSSLLLFVLSSGYIYERIEGVGLLWRSPFLMVDELHHWTTEGLIILSQSVFFILLFFFVKSYLTVVLVSRVLPYLLQRFEFLTDGEFLRANQLLVGAFYFGLYLADYLLACLFLAGTMYPLYGYRYSQVCLALIGVGVGVMAAYDILRAFSVKGNVVQAQQKEMVVQPRSSILDAPSRWLGESVKSAEAKRKLEF